MYIFNTLSPYTYIYIYIFNTKLTQWVKQVEYIIIYMCV